MHGTRIIVPWVVWLYWTFLHFGGGSVKMKGVGDKISKSGRVTKNGGVRFFEKMVGETCLGGHCDSCKNS